MATSLTIVFPILLALASQCPLSQSQTPLPVLAAPPDIISQNYIDYYPGSPGAKLVFAVAHGGKIESSDIPARDRGCYNQKQLRCIYANKCPAGSSKVKTRCFVDTPMDSYTPALGKMMYGYIGATTGVYPHLIINTLQTTWLDPNQERGEGTFNNDQSVQAYNTYHNTLRSALQEAGYGLLVDIKGHDHREDWVELGYMVKPAQLTPPEDGEDNDIPPHTSINRILSLSADSVKSIYDLLSGNKSIGGYLAAEGYRTVPSPENPTPKESDYSRGGFALSVFSLLPKVSGVELSVPRSLRGGAAGPEFARHMSRALVHFLADNMPDCGAACILNDTVADAVDMKAFLTPADVDDWAFEEEQRDAECSGTSMRVSGVVLMIGIVTSLHLIRG